MNTSRRRQRSINEQLKPQISLDQFKLPGPTVIDFKERKTLKTLESLRCKMFNYNNNSIALLLACHHVFEMIFKGNLNSLLSEFETSVTPSLFKNVPPQFNGYLDHSSIKYVLKNCCLLINEAKGEAEIDQELNKTVNSYPFFQFCLVLWARSKAIQHLQKHRNEFEVLLGNQKEILLNFEQQLRYIALDTMVQSFNMRLNFQNNLTSEIYGEEIDESKQILVISDEEGTVYIQDTIVKDFDTDNTQNSMQLTMNKPPKKSRFSFDLLSVISPKSFNDVPVCTKCNGKMKLGKCGICRQQSTEKLKTTKFEHYVSMFKICQECGKKQIIYRGEYCRKCETVKLN